MFWPSEASERRVEICSLGDSAERGGGSWRRTVVMPMTGTSFDQFYGEQYDAAARLAWFLTRGSADYEDVAQESMLKVRARFGGLDKPAAYLRVVIVNACRDRQRRVGREQRRLRAELRPEMGVMSSDIELLSVVAKLSYEHRTVLTLRYWADMTDADIADAVGINEVTVRTRAHRAIKLLKQEMQR